jgi:hypothetical protein
MPHDLTAVLVLVLIMAGFALAHGSHPSDREGILCQPDKGAPPCAN